MKRTFKTLLGGFIGGAIALAGTMAVTLLAELLNPEDKSAGAVGIIAIATVPIGVIVGLLRGHAKAKEDA